MSMNLAPISFILGHHEKLTAGPKRPLSWCELDTAFTSAKFRRELNTESYSNRFMSRP